MLFETGVIIAGLTALSFLGAYLYLGYLLLGDKISFSAVLIIIPLAIITGLAGSRMGKFILYLLKIKSLFKKNYQQLIYVIICGLIIASMAIHIDNKVFGSGKEIMVTTLFTNQKHLEWYVPFSRVIGSSLSVRQGEFLHLH